ncbi:MAG: hypothetical protein AAGF12_00800, partial [Myxococcota bacterium]
APRRNNVAGIFLMQGDLEAASREVTAALEVHPDFAGGHATLAALHLSRDEKEDAHRELRLAEDLDAELPNLPMLWANYYMATHEMDRAIDKAGEAIERRPHDWQTRLGAARLYRVAGRYDDMRAEARKIMEMIPASQAEQTRVLIEQLLGPTALEAPLDLDDIELADIDSDSTELGESSLPTADFQLGGGSSLLGGDDLDLGGGPSLLEEDDSLLDGDSEGPLLNLGDPSRLRLGGGDLQLDLSD